MKLQDKLDAIHAGFESQAPAEALEIMHRATNDLVASGLHQKALGAGSEFPEFDLTDANGNPTASADLIGNGPMIINFFRGFW
ncbi:MAG: hypothetical protein AAGC74_00150 [Verrucomicrobiota bacterium]